jgi:hypothetical protein
MLCKDTFLTYLKSFGYLVVRLPRADIKPLQVLAGNGSDLSNIGDLASLLIAGTNIPLPLIKENQLTASISGQRTSDLSLGVGLSILGSVIGAMGGSKLGLDVKYEQAKTAAFEFQDVYEDKVEVIKLDQYLAEADVNPFSRYVAELLEADELCVTTSTIKSNKFTVEAKKSDDSALDVSIPEIQDIVGGNVKVSGSSQTTSKVTYESQVPLVFAFQAVRLFYDQGRYTAFEPLEPGEAAMKALGKVTADGAQRLMKASAFVRLSAS